MANLAFPATREAGTDNLRTHGSCLLPPWALELQLTSAGRKSFRVLTASLNSKTYDISRKRNTIKKSFRGSNLVIHTAWPKTSKPITDNLGTQAEQVLGFEAPNPEPTWRELESGFGV